MMAADLRVLATFLSSLAQPSTPASTPAPAVFVGHISRHDLVALEQDLHPGDRSIWMGGLYDIRLSRAIRLDRRGDRRVRPVQFRAMVTDLPRSTTRVLFVVDYAFARPVARWWDIAHERTCVPKVVVDRFDLQQVLPRSRADPDGDWCFFLPADRSARHGSGADRSLIPR